MTQKQNKHRYGQAAEEAERMTHLSLFTGIGGLDLAAEWAGFTTVGQCEFADYPTKVLEKHWPDVERWKDVRDLTRKSFEERTGRKTVIVVSGGFPCQPHSCAGRRKASADERDLWPEMRRVISDIRPRWVVAENVRGLLSSENGRFFRGILRDFADLGYSVAWGITSAASIGAVHRRARMAIVAHADSIGLQGRMSAEEQQETDEQFERICIPLLQRTNQNHLSQSGFLRKSNGVPNRVDRTKALGNCVVPQQFYPIFAAISEMEVWR